MNNKLIERHNQRDKFVIDFLMEVANESNIVYLKDQKSSNSRIPLRIQMIISFSLMDVFANYWDVYQEGERRLPRQRCCQWYDQFCKTDKNQEFSKNKLWFNFTSKRMYNFRNSIVHFFGLSKESENVHVMLAPNDWSEFEFRELRNKIKGHGTDLVAIRPNNFHTLIKKGGIVMLEDWIDIIKKSKYDETKKDQHIAGIERVYNKINEEGAVKIPLKSSKLELNKP